MKSFDYNSFDYIVSIDFGTTYSGSCYIKVRTNLVSDAISGGDYSKIRSEIKNIKWNGTKAKKVPTIAIYAKTTKQLLHWGNEAYEKWRDAGKSGKPDEITLRKFKLKLKRDETEQSENDNNDTEPLDPKLEFLYLTATTDYLRNINDTAFEFIKSRNFDVDKDQIRYILTVPAEWTENERTAMRVMAIQAGIISRDDHENRLLIINESYAATFYCENEMTTAEEREIRTKEGYRYLVCDAGGGTVDLATYESTMPFTEEDITKNVIGRCQLTTDSGKKCGSGYVDDKMEDLLIKILFHGAKDMSVKRKKEAVAPLMVQFIDNFKLNFGEHDSDEGIEFELEDRNFKIEWFKATTDENPLYEYDDCDEILTIPHDVVCARVFDPVVNQAIALIENQIRKTNSKKIDSTYLLGGFGNSQYLKRRIEEHFENQAGRIINGKEEEETETGETAAMRGAIYYGLDGLRSAQLTSIQTVPFESDDFKPDFFNVLLCFDIGYNSSRCGYYFLKENESFDENKKSIDYKKITWIDLEDSDQFRPGRNNNEPHIIPTVIEYIGEEEDENSENRDLLWGAEVDPNSKRKVSLSRIVSINKDEFQEFYQYYLNRIYKKACKHLKDSHPQLDIEKVRYCLAIENCFNFFSTREEVRDIAIKANVISKEDNPKRLLLINREDASSIFYEDSQYMKDENVVNSYSWFIELDGKNGSGTLGLYEVKPQDPHSKDQEVKEPNLLMEKPIQFEFDMMTLLAQNVYNFPRTLKDCGVSKETKEAHGECSGSLKHTTSCEKNLEEQLESFFQKNPNFSDDVSETEQTIQTDCCSISFNIPGFIKYIITPSIRELADHLLKKISQDEVSKSYGQVDNIIIKGNLMEGVPLLEADLDYWNKRLNDVGTILRLCLRKSDLTVVKYIEDIKIANDKQHYPHHISQNDTDSILKTQGESVINRKKKAYLNHFLQIQILRDCVYLTLHEAATINQKTTVNANRNIRRLRSTTVEFNFIATLLNFLQQYRSTQDKKYIIVCKDHDMDSEDYEEHLLQGLLNYVKYHINLEDNTDFKGKSNQIHHPFGACCSFKLSPHHFISRVLKPTIKRVVDEIYTHILQASMMQQYILDNVVMLGEFIETSDDSKRPTALKELIKDITYGELFALGICRKKDDIIQCGTESRGSEVIYGAAFYGLYPTIYTQRISRRTYAVSVVAYNNMTEKKRVDLYHQPKSGSSMIDIIPTETMPFFVLIKKGGYVSAEVQTVGTFKRFFAKEDCVAYAIIHATEENTTEEEASNASYRNIHQFEVSLNRERIYDKSYVNVGSRLSFEIRMVFPNNNETRFEANILGSVKRSEIPEFRFRDQILVTNIYK